MRRELQSFVIANLVLGVLTIAALSILIMLLYRSAWDGVHFGVPAGPRADGPVRIMVDQHSPAADKDLRTGDVVVKIDRKSPRQAGATRLFTNSPRLFWVARGRQRLEVTVSPRRLIESRSSLILLAVRPLVAIFLLGLGALVHYRKPGDARARLFHWICGLLAVITVSPFVALAERMAPDLLFVVSMTVVISAVFILIPATALHLCLIFPRPRPVVERRPAVLAWIYLPGCLFALLYFVSALNAPMGTITRPRLVAVIGGVVTGLIYFILACVSLIKSYRASGLEEKRQIRWPVWGIVVALAASVFTQTLLNTRFSTEEGMSQVQFGLDPRFLVIIPITFAFAILKHRLLGIDNLIKKTIVYTALSGALIMLYVLLVAVLGRIFVATSGVRSQTVTIVSTLAIAGACIPLRNRIQRVVDRRLFREPYQHAKALRIVSDEILQATKLGPLFQNVAQHLCDILKVRSVVIFSRERFMRFFTVSGQAGLAESEVQDATISATSSLADLSSILRATADSLNEEDSNTVQRTHSSLIVPVRLKKELVALVGVGPKLSDKEFDVGDEEFLLDVARQLAVGIENQRLRMMREAESEWRALDRPSRLIFVALTRMESEHLVSKQSLRNELKRTFSASGVDLSPAQIEAGVERLLGSSALILRNGRFEIGHTSFLGLPDLARPLPDLARELKQRIGAYELIEKIGSGGMSEVFRALNVHDGSLAAIKLLPTLETSREEARKRLEREGAIVSSLAHPNVVRLLERGEHDGRIYLAMEFLEGETLSTAIRRSSWDAATAHGVAVEIASALAVLHSAGVIHRDVKSSNIMVTKSGRAVLLDFGIARSVASSSITTHQQVLGSLPYISPEQLRGESVDPRTDVWSFGIVMTEIFTGRRPWKSTDATNLALEILSTRPEVSKTGVDAGIISLIQRMIEPDLVLRVRDGMHVLRELNQLAPLLPVEGRLPDDRGNVDQSTLTFIKPRAGS